MPEFELDWGTIDGGKWFMGLDEFTQGYVKALFFTNTGTPDDMELQNATVADLAPETRATILNACKLFQTHLAYRHWCEAMDDSNWNGPGNPSAEKAGMDFWFTRCGHGVGFWEGESRGYPEPFDSALTAASETYGNQDLYMGDDGLLYLL